MNKTYAASNNLFFTGAQLLTYCKSDNSYEKGICDGYIIAVNYVIFSIDEKRLRFVYHKIYLLKKLDYLFLVL